MTVRLLTADGPSVALTVSLMGSRQFTLPMLTGTAMLMFWAQAPAVLNLAGLRTTAARASLRTSSILLVNSVMFTLPILIWMAM